MLLLAVLPGIVLFVVVFKSDKTEKEPGKLLLKLFLFGALTTISAIIIGILGEKIFSFLNPESMLYILIDNLILTALVEEAGKYIVLKKITWKNPAFNYTFDAVVYAVTVSLGFATLENIVYLIDAGVGTGIMRAVMSVPGHAMYGVFMGYYYGLAKYAEAEGNKNLVNSNLKKALIVPTLLHGFYDFCIGAGTNQIIFLLFLLIFEIVLTVFAVKKLKKLSREDMAIGNDSAEEQV